MSLTSKIALGASISFTVGIVYYVHFSQRRDRERMRDGVVRDVERQKRKQQNTEMLEEQIKLTKLLEKERDKENNTS